VFIETACEPVHQCSTGIERSVMRLAFFFWVRTLNPVRRRMCIVPDSIHGTVEDRNAFIDRDRKYAR